ncbi:TolC family protein [Roseimaritima sediminicola]|uniref:TolC family protein n=1 Tax=Roseimaritima sediminicola TaxID=2662066 RepID=UPI0013872FBF|nr:TolC family protein [Roseimaritima sediminicola]
MPEPQALASGLTAQTDHHRTPSATTGGVAPTVTTVAYKPDAPAVSDVPETGSKPVGGVVDGPVEQLRIPADEPVDEPVDELSVQPLDDRAADTTVESISTPQPISTPTVTALAASVRRHYPLIQQSLAARTIASGEVLAANGAFDHKLEAASESQPLDYYENYRHNIGVKRDTYWGGQVFAGYRIGRGEFEPWYRERETNKGGEFKAGIVVPLAKDRAIDANRAELWRAQLERQRVEPEIRAMVIASVRDATVAYWQWVAAAAGYRIAEGVLKLGVDRRSYLQRQVSLGEKAEIELVDNRRIILSRSAKAADARRKLQQAASKLSLYLRDDVGRPIELDIDTARATFPDALPPEAWGDAPDLALAQRNRPELEQLQLARQQLMVLLQQARNETLPELDAGLLAAQDVGEPTSSKRDKSEFEIEAAVTFAVPVQRRKALGKARQLRGKLAQVQAKTQFAAEKITIEAEVAHAALLAAAQRVEQTSEGLELAQRMQAAEQRLYEAGQSTLFNLNLREQQTVEAAVDRVAALYDYHVAAADYAAALGYQSSEALQP